MLTFSTQGLPRDPTGVICYTSAEIVSRLCTSVVSREWSLAGCVRAAHEPLGNVVASGLVKTVTRGTSGPRFTVRDATGACCGSWVEFDASREDNGW